MSWSFSNWLDRKNLDAHVAKDELIRALQDQCHKLATQVYEYQQKVPTASEVIKGMLGRDISWFDYRSLATNEQQAYWSDAKSLLENPVFVNELNAYIHDLKNQIAYGTGSHEETMATRTLIVGLETFKDRVESIKHPIRDQDTEKIHEAI